MRLKPIFILILLFSTITGAHYSYSKILICSKDAECAPPVSGTTAVYVDQFRCIDLDNGYEVCLVGTESYFCIKTSGGEKECVKL
jgi:hypothetical protein